MLKKYAYNLVLTVISVSFLLACPASNAEQWNQGFNSPDILEGLTTVTVLIGQLNPWAQSHGITTDMLQSAAITKLKSAGIQIASASVEEPPGSTNTKKDVLSQPTIPILYIRLKTNPEKQGSFATYSVDLSLVDRVTTKRNAKEILVSVWDANEIGRVDQELPARIDQTLGQQFNAFIADYRTANNKPVSQH